MWGPTNTMRVLIATDEVPMKKIKELRNQLSDVRDYLMNNSLGSLDERILLNDIVAALIALASLEFRKEEDQT